MTTIVANLECMAADQRCTSGGPMCHVQKIHRIGASLFGMAGDAMLGIHILRWLHGKRDPAQLYKLIPDAHRDSVDILELSAEGLAFWNGWGVRLPLLDSAFAIGSGSMSALAAMRTGATPEQAVLHAAALDEGSGIFSKPHVELLVLPKKRRA